MMTRKLRKISGLLMNFVLFLNSLDRVGTVQNTIPEQYERHGLFKKSKASVAKLMNALNPEPVFGITSMSKNPITGVEKLCVMDAV